MTDERDIVAEARAIVPTLNWAPPEILRGMLEAYDEARAEIPRLRAEVAARTPLPAAVEEAVKHFEATILDLDAEANRLVRRDDGAIGLLAQKNREVAERLRAILAHIRAQAGEIETLKSDVTDLVQAASDEATALEAIRSEALEVVGPFAEAKSCLDNTFPDHGEIWETSAAMMIEARHLRNAAKFLAKHGGSK